MLVRGLIFGVTALLCCATVQGADEYEVNVSVIGADGDVAWRIGEDSWTLAPSGSFVVRQLNFGSGLTFDFRPGATDWFSSHTFSQDIFSGPDLQITVGERIGDAQQFDYLGGEGPRSVVLPVHAIPEPTTLALGAAAVAAVVGLRSGRWR